jgi:hypothetical protein
MNVQDSIFVRLRVMLKSHNSASVTEIPKSHRYAIGHAGALRSGSLLAQIAGLCDHRDGLFGVVRMKCRCSTVLYVRTVLCSEPRYLITLQ